MRVLTFLAASILAASIMPGFSCAGQNAGDAFYPGAGMYVPGMGCTTLQVSDPLGIEPSYASPGGQDNYLAVYVGRVLDPVSVVEVDFGIDYGAALEVLTWDNCGWMDWPTEGEPAPLWPFSGSGNQVLFAPSTPTGNAILVGWFRVAVSVGYPGTEYGFCFGPHPEIGVARVLDEQDQYDDVAPACASFSSPPVGLRERTWGRIKALYGR